MSRFSLFRRAFASLLLYAIQIVLDLEKLLDSQEIRRFTVSAADTNNVERYRKGQ